MTEYRELGPDEPIALGDEYWFEEREGWERSNRFGETPGKNGRYRRPLPDSCTPTQRNTGTCERCNELEGKLATYKAMIDPVPGQTWDADKGHVPERIFDLFEFLYSNGLGPSSTLLFTVRSLICNYEKTNKANRELSERCRRMEEQLRLADEMAQQSRNTIARNGRDGHHGLERAEQAYSASRARPEIEGNDG